MFKYKNTKFLALFITLAALLGSLSVVVVSAEVAPGCYIQGQNVACPTNQSIDQSKCYTASASSQGISKFFEVPCDDSLAQNPRSNGNPEGDCRPQNGAALDKDNCGIVYYIVAFTNILSGLVGIVIVIMIAVGGIQYTTARDDPQAVSAAKDRLRNAIFALVFYLFGFAFLQYLIPGGIF